VVRRPSIPSIPVIDVAVGAIVFLLPALIYFAAGTVYVRSADPAIEIERADNGVQDQFVGLDAFSTNDSSAVIAQSLSIVNDRDISFRPVEIPNMLHWAVAGMEHQGGVFSLPALDERLRDWIEAGVIRPVHHHPQIVKTTIPNRFLSCFGMGGAITAAPAFALGQMIFGPLDQQPDILDRIAFTLGSLLVAASAVFLYAALRGSLQPRLAFLLTFAYAMGTAVFSTSSQGMWQHSATAFFGALSLALLPRTASHPGFAYPLGFCLAMATLSRPTMGIIAVMIALQLLITDWRSFLRLSLTAAPLALLLLYANHSLLGSPFTFGQTALVEHAREKTGVAAIWQTPIMTGLAGLLISPSRGLFVYSPFLLASVAGMAVVAWSSVHAWMRGVALAIPIILLVESRHFDWWGGWSYGYRHLVDLSPFLVLLMAPVAPLLSNSGRGRVLFGGAILVSIGVQVLGVTANDVWRWNAPLVYLLKDPQGQVVRETPSYADFVAWTTKPGHTGEPIVKNIDREEYRDRLWSLSDHQIGFYLANARRTARSRQSQMWNARQPAGRKIAEAYRQVAIAYAKAQALDRAVHCLIWSYEADPGYQENLLALWDVLPAQERRVDSVVSLLRQHCITAPDDWAARVYLAFALIEQGNATGSIGVLEEVLRVSPEKFQHRYESMSQVFARRLRDKPIARTVNEIGADVDLVDNVMSYLVTMRRQESAGDFPAALAACDEIARLAPALPSLPSHRARLFLAAGDETRARSLLRSNSRPPLSRDEDRQETRRDP
jgi:tetratricopeptide (TPR) repeat protein